MQHCGKCGDYNLDESIFCSHCGNRLNYNCLSCGFTNLPQQEFCGGCGKQLSEAPSVPAPLGRSVSSPAPEPASLQMTPTVSAQPAPPPPSLPDSPGGVTSVTVASPPAETPVIAESAPLPPKSPPEPLEEERFPLYQTLEAYALLSVECVPNPETPGNPDEIRGRCIREVGQQALLASGHTQISKAQIAFITFKQEESLLASLQKGIDFALDLLQRDWKLPVRLKIGLDVERAATRDPLTSTLERSLSAPGTLIVSEAAYHEVQNLYRVEALEEKALGNRTLRCYRVLSPGAQLPEAQSVLEPHETPTKPQPLPTGLSVPDEPAFQQEPEAPPEPQPTPDGPPQLPKYNAPTLGLLQEEARSYNIDYTQAIEALHSDLSAFLAQGTATRGRMITLAAEDGLGKSNIIHMVRGKIDPNNEKAIWLGGANYSCFTEAAPPLFFWIEVLQNMMSFVQEGQERIQVQGQIEKFLAFIYEGQVPQEEADFLFDLLLVNPIQPITEDTRQLSGRLEQFFKKFFRHLARKRPLVLVLEDIQHADPASLELLARLLDEGLLNLPISILITQTPDFYAAGNLATSLQKGSYKELVISPLNDADAERFLNDGPLGGQLADFPVPLIDSILRHAQGLPLYLEEGLRLLHLRGVLTVDEHTHKFQPTEAYDAETAFLPQSMERLIRERLEHLSEATRYILQVASVLGERFSVNMLMAISQAKEEEFNQALTTLFNHGYLIPDAVNTGRFRHAVLWNTVYQSLAPDWREQMHQLISEALEDDFQKGLTVSPFLVAHHAEQGNLPIRALNFWNLCGLFAGRLGAWTGMNLALLRALELLRQQEGPLYANELALRIVETLGRFNIHHEPAHAVAWLEWAIYYRKVAGDSAHLIEPLGSLTTACEIQGDFLKALSTLETAQGLLDRKQYPTEAVSLEINKMEYLLALGRLQQARTLMESSIEPNNREAVGQSPEFQELFLQARLLYGQVLTAQCDANTLTYLEETDRLAKERNLSVLSVAVQLTRGLALLHAGEYEACNQEADALLQAIEQMENSEWFLAQWGLLAMMYHCELEDWESASQLTLTVLSKAEESRDYLTSITAQAYSGYIAGRLGRIQEARQTLEKALQQASDHRMAGAALIGWRLLADFEHSLGNQEVAYELASKALEIAKKPEIRNQYEILQLSILCARSLLAYGEIKTAGKVLEHLWLQAVQSKMRPIIATTAAEIGQLYKQMANDAPADLSKKHLMRSTEFFLKAKGIWLELRHLPNVKRVDAGMPRL